MDMFSILREQLDIVSVAEDFTKKVFKPIGENTFAAEDKECLFCGHKDCMRIKKDEDESFFKCFSCDASGDVVDLVAKLEDISNVEAARLLAKTYKIQLPNDYSPVQDALNLAANYYHQNLIESGPFAELNGLTPLEYQTQIRRHTEASVSKFKIGWSDGKVIAYLEAMGIAPEVITETGLINKKGQDFLPAKVFIYPHYVRGRVSHFTFKDPLKQKEYQLPNKFKLNGHMFYGSDSIRSEAPVILVEGENDLISVDEANWGGGIICCNGSISSAQLEWLSTNLEKRDLITIFDADNAGDGYRTKVGKLRNRFKTLTQIKLSNGVKDIDEYLKNGGSLEACLENNKVSVDGEEESTVEIDTGSSNNLIEKNGAYYRVRYKDGEEFHIKLSNFVIKLRNIFIRGKEREREVILKREDGIESDPVLITSDTKVGLKPFKSLAANSIDASFYGKEEDLAALWEFVYRNGHERLVYVPEQVGRIEKFKGWLFRDCFITDTGALYKPDEEGIIWITNGSVGIKPISITSNIEESGSGNTDIPEIMSLLTEEDSEESYLKILKGFADNLAENLGGPNSKGEVLTMLGFMWSCIYSNQFFATNKNFPFLYLWGRAGKGKTTIMQYLLGIYGMEETGYNSMSQYGTGVGIGRKLAYYSSLPVCLDEIRTVDLHNDDKQGVFRSWYDRAPRSVADSSTNKVRTNVVRSVVMFSGEDQFPDPATRQRCIPIRIRKDGRETVRTYSWFVKNTSNFKNIGFHWLKQYSEIKIPELIKEMTEMAHTIRRNGISDRSAIVWSVAGVFGRRICEQIWPEYNYMAYLFAASKEDAAKQYEDDTLTHFWEMVEGMQSAERSVLNGTHLKKNENKLYVWFAEVFRLIQKEETRVAGSTFSKRAILDAIHEEDYFIEEDRVRMGINESPHRVMVLDLTKAPEVLQNIAGSLT